MAASPSPARRALASLSLGGSAVGLGVIAAQLARFGDWALFGVVLLVAAGAAGLSRRGVLVQVLSRAVAWVVLTPMLFALAEAARRGAFVGKMELFLAASSAGALLLARPALHTPAARAEFAPALHRRLFLAGAVASATAGLVAGMGAVATMSVPAALLAAGLLGAAVGVARMRTWGVLLGLVTSLASLAVAFLTHDEIAGIGLVLAAVHGAMLGATVLGARVRARLGQLPATSVAVEALPESITPVRARIAVDPDVEPEALAAPVRVSAGSS